MAKHGLAAYSIARSERGLEAGLRFASGWEAGASRQLGLMSKNPRVTRTCL